MSRQRHLHRKTLANQRPERKVKRLFLDQIRRQRVGWATWKNVDIPNLQFYDQMN